MASSSTLFSPSSPSSASQSHSPLLRLPAVLFERVCSYLPPKELLLGLAQTAKSTRATLSPGCFSCDCLALGGSHLQVLASLCPPSSLQSSFHARVLAECRLSLSMFDAVAQELIVDCLHHFPACGALDVTGDLAPRQLYALLHSPTVQSCHVLSVTGTVRTAEKKAAVGGGAGAGQRAAASLQAQARLRLGGHPPALSHPTQPRPLRRPPLRWRTGLPRSAQRADPPDCLHTRRIRRGADAALPRSQRPASADRLLTQRATGERLDGGRAHLLRPRPPAQGSRVDGDQWPAKAPGEAERRRGHSTDRLRCSRPPARPDLDRHRQSEPSVAGGLDRRAVADDGVPASAALPRVRACLRGRGRRGGRGRERPLSRRCRARVFPPPDGRSTSDGPPRQLRAAPRPQRRHHGPTRPAPPAAEAESRRRLQ